VVVAVGVDGIIIMVETAVAVMRMAIMVWVMVAEVGH
jgi:hypothetical protein